MPFLRQHTKAHSYANEKQRTAPLNLEWYEEKLAKKELLRKERAKKQARYEKRKLEIMGDDQNLLNVELVLEKRIMVHESEKVLGGDKSPRSKKLPFGRKFRGEMKKSHSNHLAPGKKFRSEKQIATWREANRKFQERKNEAESSEFSDFVLRNPVEEVSVETDNENYASLVTETPLVIQKHEGTATLTGNTYICKDQQTSKVSVADVILQNVSKRKKQLENMEAVTKKLKVQLSTPLHSETASSIDPRLMTKLLLRPKSGNNPKKIVRARSYKNFQIHWEKYVHKLVKREHLTISKKGMQIMCDMMTDWMDRIMQEAKFLCRRAKRVTLRAYDIRAAMKILVPKGLYIAACYKAYIALAKVSQSYSK
jgi:histone H3/H4